MKTHLPLVAIVGFAVTLAMAADKPAGSAHELKQFKLGDHLFGPPVSAATMQGKAVMLDCWGIHCGPCLAMMPEVEGYAKQYAKRLVVVGVHSQENDKPAIEAVVKKNKLSYAIVNSLRSPVQFTQLPHVFLFDAAGHMIFSGSPFEKEFKSALHKAVASTDASGASATPSGLDALKKLATPTPAPVTPAARPTAAASF